MTRQNIENIIDPPPMTDAVIAATDKPLPVKPRSQPLILTLLQLIFKLGEYLSPSITGKIAYNLWLSPTRFKTPASEKDALASAKIKFHRIDKRSIASYHWGNSGPAILLVHGWSGRGTQLGSFVQPLLDAGYQVFSFDAPAHGKSSGKQTNIYEFADTILAMQTIFGEFHSVITHSFGGPCTAVALQRGLTTKHVVTICPPSTTTGLVDKFCNALNIQEKTEKVIQKNIEHTFGENIWHDTTMVNNVKSLATANLRSVTVIHDAHDSDIPWREGQAVAHAWNNAPFVITSGLGHRRILRDKGVIGTVLKSIG